MTYFHVKRNKYGAKKTVYGGITYDSKREAEYAAQLDMQRLARGKDKVESWERQLPIKIIVNDVLICTYKVDFLVRYADGRKVLVEVKGYWTPEARLKRKLLEATFLKGHPEIKYQIIK